jgi:hypothetical protein
VVEHLPSISKALSSNPKKKKRKKERRKEGKERKGGNNLESFKILIPAIHPQKFRFEISSG